MLEITEIQITDMLVCQTVIAYDLALKLIYGNKINLECDWKVVGLGIIK